MINGINLSNVTSNYVACGACALMRIIYSYLQDPTTPPFADMARGDNYISVTSNKCLHSFGEPIDKQKKNLSPNHTRSFLNSVRGNIKRDNRFQNMQLYVDSGGFQLANGDLKKEYILPYIDLYYNMIKDNMNIIDFAFILDIPPGPGSKDIFSSYDEIENFNRISYRKCIEILPPEFVQNHMIYIHHFRTPNLKRIWNKFLFDENLADKFKYFATGGLVANNKNDYSSPCALVVLPLVHVLKYNMDRGVTEFPFHVLGGAQFTEIFMYKMVEYHLEKIHGVKVKITYDSSMIFKAFCIGRVLKIFIGDELHDLDIRSSNLKRVYQNKTCEDHVYDLFNMVSSLSGFGVLDKTNCPIYNDSTGTFSTPVMPYLFMYVMYLFKHVEDLATRFVPICHQHYMNENWIDFNKNCQEMLMLLHKGRYTKSINSKVATLKNTLDFLMTIDVEKSNSVIDNYLSVDDILVENTEESLISW